MTITVPVHNDTIMLPKDLHWPDGMLVRVEPVEDVPEAFSETYFEDTAGALAREIFERPAQGNAEQRESW